MTNIDQILIEREDKFRTYLMFLVPSIVLSLGADLANIMPILSIVANIISAVSFGLLAKLYIEQTGYSSLKRYRRRSLIIPTASLLASSYVIWRFLGHLQVLVNQNLALPELQPDASLLVLSIALTLSWGYVFLITPYRRHLSLFQRNLPDEKAEEFETRITNLKRMLGKIGEMPDEDTSETSAVANDFETANVEQQIQMLKNDLDQKMKFMQSDVDDIVYNINSLLDELREYSGVQRQRSPDLIPILATDYWTALLAFIGPLISRYIETLIF
jgi:hypothetical protein